jgi:chemotaxis protein histidine kinase CheA
MSSPEPVLDMTEIVGLYKEDARRMVGELRSALGRWDEVVHGGAALSDLRRLSHQLRGSGRTYGFRSVTRVSKAIERIVQKLERQAVAADDRVRHAVARKIDRLDAIFRQ